MTYKLKMAFCIAVLIATAAGFQLGRLSSLGDSTQLAPKDRLVTVYYPVEDLVTRWIGAGSSDKPDFETLMTLVTTEVAPGSWNGEKAITAVSANRLMAVTHTVAVHNEIASLLNKCRQPISYYEDCVAKDACMHCGVMPVPKIGNTCDRCGNLRCAPRFDTPKIAAIPPLLK